MLGWRLVEEEGDLSDGARTVPVLARHDLLAPDLKLRLANRSAPQRARTLLVGVESSSARADWLRQGLGDVLGIAALDEIECRLLRLATQIETIPRERLLGPLRLDLIARDGFCAGRPIGLLPREFALLWRLADDPGAALSPQVLLRDVWQLSFRPETNSLAVHISRLRARLRQAGCGELVQTATGGAYRLALPAPLTREANLPLDAYLRLREESCVAEQDLGHAA